MLQNTTNSNSGSLSLPKKRLHGVYYDLRKC